jgi:hypothetical protein
VSSRTSCPTPQQNLTLQQEQLIGSLLPLFVVPWVLQEIAATDVFELQPTMPAQVRPYITKAQDEAHARRLVRCWAEYEQEFLGCLCQELSAFLRTHLKFIADMARNQEVTRVAAFLTKLFTDTELSMVEHKQGLNRKSLWRSVIC